MTGDDPYELMLQNKTLKLCGEGKDRHLPLQQIKVTFNALKELPVTNEAIKFCNS
jgi:hypothetical protein